MKYDPADLQIKAKVFLQTLSNDCNSPKVHMLLNRLRDRYPTKGVVDIIFRINILAKTGT